MQLPDVLPGDPRRGDEDDGKTHRGRGTGGTQVKQEPPNPQVGVYSLSRCCCHCHTTCTYIIEWMEFQSSVSEFESSCCSVF